MGNAKEKFDVGDLVWLKASKKSGKVVDSQRWASITLYDVWVVYDETCEVITLPESSIAPYSQDEEWKKQKE